ncbi:hypothetical protein NLX62_04400 [Mycobacteriaceae bacterium Msp059]|nr:hypothetical protein [Mycobacteriaceae bacterium Msp059]
MAASRLGTRSHVSAAINGKGQVEVQLLVQDPRASSSGTAELPALTRATVER